jgi:hypothetical protein
MESLQVQFPTELMSSQTHNEDGLGILAVLRFGLVVLVLLFSISLGSYALIVTVKDAVKNYKEKQYFKEMNDKFDYPIISA